MHAEEIATGMGLTVDSKGVGTPMKDTREERRREGHDHCGRQARPWIGGEGEEAPGWTGRASSAARRRRADP